MRVETFKIKYINRKPYSNKRLGAFYECLREEDINKKILAYCVIRSNDNKKAVEIDKWGRFKMKDLDGAFPIKEEIYRHYFKTSDDDEFKYRIGCFLRKPSTMYVVSAYIEHGRRYKPVKYYYIITKNDGNELQLARFKTLWQMNMFRKTYFLDKEVVSEGKWFKVVKKEK